MFIFCPVFCSIICICHLSLHCAKILTELSYFSNRFLVQCLSFSMVGGPSETDCDSGHISGDRLNQFICQINSFENGTYSTVKA